MGLKGEKNTVESSCSSTPFCSSQSPPYPFGWSSMSSHRQGLPLHRREYYAAFAPSLCLPAETHGFSLPSIPTTRRKHLACSEFEKLVHKTAFSSCSHWSQRESCSGFQWEKDWAPSIVKRVCEISAERMSKGDVIDNSWQQSAAAELPPHKHKIGGHKIGRQYHLQVVREHLVSYRLLYGRLY